MDAPEAIFWKVRRSLGGGFDEIGDRVGEGEERS